ncbi:MAG: AI-2E family transporter [Cyanobacteria bacterium P01_G01_bin.49]
MNFGQWISLSSLIISCYILWEIRKLLLLILTAVIFATALNRLVKLLQRFKIQRLLAIIIVSIGITLAGILFVGLVVPPFIEQFQNLVDLLPSVWKKLRISLIILEETQTAFDWLPSSSFLENVFEQLQPLLTNIFRNFFALFSNSLSAILQFIFVAVLTVMMVINPQQYRCAFLRLFPSFYRRRGDEILGLSDIALGNWLMGITINCLFIGTLSGLGLWILQIKLVLVHALLAGLLNFIPNIGPAASVIFPLMVALLDDSWKIWAILCWYFIIQNVESYWLTPMIMAKQVSLLPAMTLMSQIFFARSFGLLGLLLALPLAVIAKTWVEEVLFKDILDTWH